MLERWAGAFRRARYNYEIIGVERGVNEFATIRYRGTFCDLCVVRFAERSEKMQGAETVACCASAFGWSFVRDPWNFLPVLWNVQLTDSSWDSVPVSSLWPFDPLHWIKLTTLPLYASLALLGIMGTWEQLFYLFYYGFDIIVNIDFINFAIIWSNLFSMYLKLNYREYYYEI